MKKQNFLTRKNHALKIYSKTVKSIFKLRNNLTTKANELRKASNNTLKMLNSDEKFKVLEQNVKDLSQKVRNSRWVAVPSASSLPRIFTFLPHLPLQALNQ